MKKLSILLSATLLIFSYSCSTEKHSKNENQGTKALALYDAHAPVQWDNGSKWTANIETTQGIQNMTQLIDNSFANPTANLKESLLTEFTAILNKCTMKGESHEQLHNYLLPLKSDIENLTDPPAREELKSIQLYLATYYNYFH